MATKPFFGDSESPYFDNGGMPVQAGIYEFHRSDGRRILYTLEFMEAEEELPARLKVVHCSSMADYPYPAHALNTLDGDWVRFLGPPSPVDPGESEGPEGPEGPDGTHRQA
ncbi:MAG: hypothetical protein JWP91_4531 [Fibrobacteres bacterium]|nr:hypothetical protein [Fibrobacterota bacterium]